MVCICSCLCACVYLRTRVVKTHSTAVNDLYDHQEDLTYLLLFKFICFVCIFSYGWVITCLISYIIKVKVLEGVIPVEVKKKIGTRKSVSLSSVNVSYK